MLDAQNCSDKTVLNHIYKSRLDRFVLRVPFVTLLVHNHVCAIIDIQSQIFESGNL